MKPRDFLNFFKTKSGKLLTFGVLFAAALIIFSTCRGRQTDPENPVAATPLTTNLTDKPQVVETVQRPLEVYRPPAPKPEPVQTPEPKTINSGTDATQKTNTHQPESLAPISLLADGTVGIAEPKTWSDVFAPFGRLISCETVITVDSASIQTPIIGLITESVYHAGRLVIPAGTEVHGTAQTDRHRERIGTGSSWTLVWQTGEEMQIKAIALDREFENSTNQTGWAITDGSAGLRGRIIKSDDLAEIKLFAATFLSGATDALTEKEQTIFGSVNSPSLNNAPMAGAQEVLKTYAQRIYDSIQKEGFYVRVPSGKQFYLYVLQTIDRTDAVIGGRPATVAEEKNEPTTPRL